MTEDIKLPPLPHIGGLVPEEMRRDIYRTVEQWGRAAILADREARAASAAPGSEVANVVPGKMHCARCKFSLNRVSLNVNVGTVTAGDNKTEPCPNGCGPLWPVTWEQEAREGWAINESMFECAKAAEDALAAIRAEPFALATPQAERPAEPAADASLLRRASRQLSRWHEKYGEHAPAWIPPAGDVRLQEDIDEALATRPQVAPEARERDQ